MLKGVPKKEWPNWPILQKVFEYWAVELKGDKFYKKLLSYFKNTPSNAIAL